MLSINILLQNVILFRVEVCLIKTIISFVSLYVKGAFDIILCNEEKGTTEAKMVGWHH